VATYRPQVTLLRRFAVDTGHPGLDSAHDAIDRTPLQVPADVGSRPANPNAVINTQRMICANQ